jgi:secernin
VCDTLCVIGPEGALFAKNSDRPPAEPQLIEALPARKPGGALRTQYLMIDDAGAAAILGSRPSWLWGLEHGVNEHGVAIGNEKVYTKANPNKEPPALIGMDLVRLGLERGCTADGALEAMTDALERYGQGGVCDQTTGESYFSSFVICDPVGGWVLETSGRTWVAAPVRGAAAISNRLTLRRDWTLASADVPPGADWDEWRHPLAPVRHADVRLDASRTCLSRSSGAITPADLAAHLRDHGGGPWGSPAERESDVSPVPEGFAEDGSGAGVSVCMHLRGYQNTTSSMIAELPAEPDRPARAWVAPGQPCVSIFLPVFGTHAPAALGDPATWHAFAALRDHAEADAGALADIRGVFGPLEAELWAEADAVSTRPDEHVRFAEEAWRRVAEALQRATARSGSP